jgi:hypothetical protein
MVWASSIQSAASARPSARNSRTGSDGPLRERGLRAGWRLAGRRVDVRDRLDVVRLLPDERVLGRDRVGVRVATRAG